MEFKTVSEFKVIESARVVTGYPSICGNVDDGGDLVRLGAYRKTLQERGERFRWLWQHDYGHPPTAKILEVREVGREDLPEALVQLYPEAEGALRVKREYLDTPRGNEVLLAIQSGALSEMSIGYDPILVEYPENVLVGGRPVRRVLREMRLWEFSDVNWGMNAATLNDKGLLQRYVRGEALAAEDAAALVETLRQLDQSKVSGLLQMLMGVSRETSAGKGVQPGLQPVAQLLARVERWERELRTVDA